MLITRILSVLPNKFDHFHSAWDSVEEEKKTLDRLSTRLMAEEITWKKDDQETSVALVTKDSNYKREQQKQSSKREYEKQGPSRFNCGKVGHLKKDCFRCFTCKRKGHTSKNCFKNKKGNNSRDNQEPRIENRDHSGIGLLGSTSTIQVANHDAWIIDSGATDHMTGRQEWFSFFEKFDNTVKIEIGDGTYMDAYGKGKIKVETFVDGKWVACTMNDALYVPGMNRNLFSIRSVAKRGIDFCILREGKNCMFFTKSENNRKGFCYWKLI